METVKISKCCGAETTEKSLNNSNYMMDYCLKCKKQCALEEVCAECLGTGIVLEDEHDGEGHIMRGVNERPCIECSPDNY